MKRVLNTSLILGALLLAGAGNVRAQHWTKLSLPNIYREIAPYFLNENIGFVFDVSPKWKANLRRTTDGGNSWTVLRFFDDRNIYIQQIFFTDSNRGYAAASDGAYETQDMGNNWRKIYTSNSFPLNNVQIYGNSIYAFGNKVFFYSSYLRNSLTFGPFVMTSNDGKSWDTIITQKIYPDNFPYVFGNKDSIVYAEDIDSLNNMFLVYSTNNGKNWSSNNMDVPHKTATMGLFSLPHCKDLFRTFIAPFDSGGEDVYQIVHSSDFGAHWDTVKTLEVGAWIAGNTCVQYLSDAQYILHSTNRSGVWRSEDHGKNWTYINGPNLQEIDDDDFHNISVVGGGAVVYVADPPTRFRTIEANLWKTTDGGDGTLSSAVLASNVSLAYTFQQRRTICDTSNLIITYMNLSCNYAFLQYFSIDGLDSNQYSSQWRHHLVCDGVPDSIVIRVFDAPAGSNTYRVHLHFINDEFKPIDSTFDFTLSQSYIATNISVKADASSMITICDTALFTLTYQNFSCNYSTLKNFTIVGLDSSNFLAELKQHSPFQGLSDTFFVKIFTLPPGIRIYTIHAHFINDQFESFDTSFNFSILILPFPTVKFYLHPSFVNGESRDIIDVPIFGNSSQNLSGSSTATLTYSLNTNLLTPLSFIPISGVTADPVQITKTTATVTLHFDPPFTFSGETEFGRLRCVAYVTDTLETNIVLTGAAHSSGCLATLADSNTVHFTLTGCGASTLSNFMKFGTAYNILSIVPNPAGNSVKVELKNNGSLLHYELLDALGALQKSGTTADNLLQINLSGLSLGNYYFRLSGEGGMPITKKIMVVK